MAETLVDKRSDGSYALNERGEWTAYFYTLQKLLSHYLQKGMRMQPAQAQQKLSKLRQFSEQNIHTIDDYLEKLPQISNFIGENNLQKLSSFISQHFITSLDKIREQLYERELPKAKDRYENPYRVPGNDLLDEFEEAFSKAKILSWPPINGRVTHADASASDVEMIRHEPQDTRPPGEKLLEQVSTAFMQAKPLIYPPGVASLPAAAGAGPPSTEQEFKDDTERSKMPSQRMLASLGSEFDVAKSLSYGDHDEGSHYGSNDQTSPYAALPTQVLFKEYTQMMGSVSKFSKTRDNAGYQAWLAKLAPQKKAAIHINNFHSKELNGQTIPWPQQLNKVSTAVFLDITTLSKIKEEIVAYRKVLIKLQGSLRQAAQKSGNPLMIQKLYAQLVSIFENRDTISSKKTSLKMLLLQVTHAESKNYLQQELDQLIDNLKELYHLD